MMHIKTLKNDLKVYLIPLENAKTVSLFVGAKVGSRYETREINGISHFLEHLMFKGTKKRPNQLFISKELDAIGAQFNAYTAKDRTVYYANSTENNFKVINDVLADMLQNSLFDAQEMEKEKGVIIEEIHMYDDNPLMKIEDLVEELTFGDNSLGWDIAGLEKNIKSMTRDDIVSYYKAYYHPENLFLVVAGNFDKDKIYHLIEKEWEEMSKADVWGVEYKSVKVETNAPKLKIYPKDTKQIQLALAFPAYSYTDDKRFASRLLSVILGGNMSSRLFTHIREKLGLCYLIRSYENHYEDNGLFIIQAGLEKMKIKDAIQAILKELENIKTELVSDLEFKNAKSYLEGKYSLKLETAEANASWYMEQVLFHQEEMLTPEEYLEKIKEVKKEDILAVAQDLFQSNKINLALLGDVKYSEEEIRDLLVLN